MFALSFYYFLIFSGLNQLIKMKFHFLRNRNIIDITSALDIYCDASNTCTCDATTPCSGANIICNNNAVCNVFCTQNGQNCGSANIYCPDDYACNIYGSQVYQIQSGTIYASKNEPTIVQCTGQNVCRYTQFIGGDGPNSILEIQCNFGSWSIENNMIDARNAAELRITECGGSNGCSGLRVYCPQNVNGVKKCSISGNDGWIGGRTLTVYAVNGWKDTDFSATAVRQGTMYCTSNYGQSCSIDPNAWGCTDPAVCAFEVC